MWIYKVTVKSGNVYVAEAFFFDRDKANYYASRYNKKDSSCEASVTSIPVQ